MKFDFCTAQACACGYVEGAMIGNIGIWELILILVIIMIIFGASRLKGIGKSLGEGIKEFKKATKELEEKPEKPAETEQKKLEDNNN